MAPYCSVGSVTATSRLILGRPATEELVRDRKLSRFVEDVHDDVFAEVLEGERGLE